MIYFSVAPLVSICIIFFLRIIYIFVRKYLYNFDFFFPEYCYIFQPVCTPQWPTCACPTRKGSAPSLEIFDYFDYYNIFRNIWNIWNKKRERAIFGNILSLSNLFRAPLPPLLRSDILGYNYFRHCKDWEKHFFHIDEHLKSKSTCFMLSELFGLRMLHTCDKHFEFPPIPKCLNIFYFCWFQNVWQFWCFLLETIFLTWNCSRLSWILPSCRRIKPCRIRLTKQ